MKVRYAAPAADEIEDILAFLHERSPQAADGFQRELRALARLLSQYPKAGTVTRYAWLRRLPLRQFPYLVFYEVTESEVLILAVRHGARDPSSMHDQDER